MRYRELGRTGIQLSELGFGVWTLSTGWWGTYSDDEAVALLRAAYARGVTFFDSADSYGNGRSEELLAKAFEGQRDRIVIGTKFGYDFYTNGGERNGQRELPQAWSPAFVRTALEQSLRRLGTDYVDVYQLHNPKMDAMDNDALWATLEDLRREGTIRSFGPALGPAIGWQKEGEKALLTRNCDVLHQIYNVLEQDPGRALADLARERGAGVIARVTHASGLLEGKYTEDTTFDENDHRRHRPKGWLTTGLKMVDTLQFLVRPDRTIGQVALRWLLTDANTASVLPNIYNMEQLEEFAGAADSPELTEDELARVADLYAHRFYLEPEDYAPLGAIKG